MEIITIALPSGVFGRTKLGKVTDSVLVSIKKNKEVWLGCLVLGARTLRGAGGWGGKLSDAGPVGDTMVSPSAAVIVKARCPAGSLGS